MNSKVRKLWKENRENIGVWAIVCVVAFLFLLKSPLHPWVNGNSGTDSSVFKTVALMMEKGYTPYVDSFDHKGPVIYIINWIGNMISSYRGVWVIEMVSLMFTFFYIYKTARISCGIFPSVTVMLISTSLLFGYFKGGNLTEEYAMPCIAYATFAFIDYLKKNKITKLRLVLTGAGLGITLLLRPNMIVVWGVFCIAVLVFQILKKDMKKLVFFIQWFVIGLLAVLLPVMLYLAANGAILQCFEDYILFNVQYISEESPMALFVNKWNVFWDFFNDSIYLIVVFYLGYRCLHKQNILDISYVVYLVLGFISISLSGRFYNHYAMVLVPAIAYPLSLIFEDIEKIKEQEISRFLLCIVSVYCLSTFVAPQWIGLLKEAPQQYAARETDNKPAMVINLADLVKEYTSEEESISVYGNWNIIYVLSNRRHATRYSYQFPIGEVNPAILEEYLEQLEEEKPSLMVIQAGRWDDRIGRFVEENGYQLLWSEVEDSTDGAMVWKKH